MSTLSDQWQKEVEEKAKAKKFPWDKQEYECPKSTKQ